LLPATKQLALAMEEVWVAILGLGALAKLPVTPPELESVILGLVRLAVQVSEKAELQSLKLRFSDASRPIQANGRLMP